MRQTTLLLAALALSASVAAHAASITYTDSSQSVVQSVDGLVVDGNTYDVTFASLGSPTFQGNQSGATDAANALDDVLGTSTAAFVEDGTAGSDANVDVDFNGQLGVDSTSLGMVGFWTVFGIQTDTSNAVFTAVTPVAATPEPSSIALLGTGLLGVVGVVRKRFA